MLNAFCSLFGIEIPIVQAAMGAATSPELAAAVSNAPLRLEYARSDTRRDPGYKGPDQLAVRRQSRLDLSCA
jgi:hypothetical protein